MAAGFAWLAGIMVNEGGHITWDGFYPVRNKTRPIGRVKNPFYMAMNKIGVTLLRQLYGC